MGGRAILAGFLPGIDLKKDPLEGCCREKMVVALSERGRGRPRYSRPGGRRYSSLTVLTVGITLR